MSLPEYEAESTIRDRGVPVTHRAALKRVLFAAALVVLAQIWQPAMGAAFTVDDAFTAGTPDDALDDLGDVARWSAQPGSLARDGVRGLGGGIEYSFSADFCQRISPRVVDGAGISCERIRSEARQAFERWSEGHPSLHFADVSDLIASQLPPSGDDQPWRGFGAEIDLFVLDPREHPRVRNFGAWTSFWFTRSRPLGTNGRFRPGTTMTSADIVLNADSCYHIAPRSDGSCNHFQSLLLHEIGHALGLTHPNGGTHRNWDTDDDPTNAIEIDCQEPRRGLRLSQSVDERAVMNSSLGMPEPVHAALSNDDLGGRDFMYPPCKGARLGEASADAEKADGIIVEPSQDSLPVNP